jgi:nucleotide-binding universal stress UspA family protein
VTDQASPGQVVQSREPALAGQTPPTFSRILVPLDGSRLAEAALPIATALATSCGSTIGLLHVIEKGAPTRVHGERHLTNSRDADTYLAPIAHQLTVDGRLAEYHIHEAPVGDVAESIAAHAEENDSSLIVISTHGEGGLRQVLWGSIAQQVLQRSARSVLLVRARSNGPPAAFNPRTIMVPLDATAAAENALGPATVLARCLGAELRLVIVVATTETVASDQIPTATFLPATTRALLDVQEKQATTYLEGLAEKIRASGIGAIAEVRRGETVDELAADTGEHHDGLVVVATHGRAGLQAIWSSSVATRLLRRTRAPILLVPIVEDE